MKKIDQFDVLVVYSDQVAKSAREKDSLPFDIASKHNKNNAVYAYFLKMCAKQGIKAAFATSDDIVGPGKCRAYWIFQKNKWIKFTNPCYASLIFDKFFPLSMSLAEKRSLLFSSPKVRSYTDSDLFYLFFDKLRTYEKISEYAIPTVGIKTSKAKDIQNTFRALEEKITTHPNRDDFMKTFIMKDRYGAGGCNIYKVDIKNSRSIATIMQNHKKLSFILQPFVKFDKGYQYKNYKGFTEIRFLYLRQKVVQMYIRVAQNKDFLTNHGQGGIWVTKKDIPSHVIKVAKTISKNLNKKEAFYALDFIVSNNNNVYLLEGNISPGIDWNPTYPKNEKMNQTMIKLIIKDLKVKLQDADTLMPKTAEVYNTTQLLDETPINYGT